MAENLVFKAHARLLTMLGEQLIKNERIALVELVKNSYDADATRVQVDFRAFGEDFACLPGSSIVISDNGVGMEPEVVQHAWMNPATPTKAIVKAANPVTPKGRVLQGEKGIGRFATFKLGSQMALTTRPKGSAKESTLLIDIADLDESPGSAGQRVDYYLDQLSAIYDTSDPTVFTGIDGGPKHGAQIEISGLRAAWNTRLVHAAFSDLDRLQPQLWATDAQTTGRADFEVTFLRDGVDLDLGAQRSEEFQAVLDRAVLRVTSGHFDGSGLITFQVNGRPFELPLEGGEVRGVRAFKDHFRAGVDDWLAPECGAFDFEFFIFDFSTNAPVQFSLDQDDKGLLKAHRIYLYRDGIRVYPYGDPNDDWLGIDAMRGTQSARSMFSNDQAVGFVKITQSGNPRLRDKTNREGLLEAGRATEDFVALIQTVLSFLRAKPYEQYAAENRRVREKALRGQRIDRHIESLRKFDLPKRAVEQLDNLEAALAAEREVSAMRVARTEQLAGVGMSVETASHDLIAAGTEALRMARHIVDELKLLDLTNEPVYAVAKSLVTRLEFVNSRFKDVQGLFVSTRQKKGPLDIAQIVRRVRSMYQALHEHEQIQFEVVEPFKLNCVSTEAAVLQCVINLVDNATYWLMTSPHRPRTIRAFTLDERTVAISDNGPGVGIQDREFIFEPFYSGKGDAGKGLGLYIAQQNGQRSGFLVELADLADPHALSGATFTVTFEEEGKKK